MLSTTVTGEYDKMSPKGRERERAPLLTTNKTCFPSHVTLERQLILS